MTGTSVRGDTTLIYGKSDFGTYKEDTATIRASGGDYGGGSEMLIIQKGAKNERSISENGSPGHN